MLDRFVTNNWLMLDFGGWLWFANIVVDILFLVTMFLLLG